MPRASDIFIPAFERPIRIPERIALQEADPPVAVVSEMATWRVPLVLAEDVAPGDVIKLQTHGNRNCRPGFVGEQVDRPGDEGCLRLRRADGATLDLSAEGAAGFYTVAVPAGGLRAGERLVLTLGATDGGGPGIRAPEHRALDKFFLLYRAGDENDNPSTWYEVNGHQIIAACVMHILGGPVRQLRAYVPAQTRPGEAFEVLVRPEDDRSNLSHEAPGDLAVFLGEKELATATESVGNSTCVRLRVALPEPGVHRLRVVDRARGIEAVANPMVCAETAPAGNVYWGMIHGHTEMSDGRESLGHYFHQIRDEAGLDFGAPGDHDHTHETSDAFWRITCETVRRWNEPGRFVAILGYEWAKWRRNGDGDRNVYYRRDDRPMFRSDEANYPSPPDLFRALAEGQEEAIVIPHHTGHGGNFCDWKDHDPVRERLVEIHQIRGSYECSEADGNPQPDRTSRELYKPGFVRNALALGWRVGFTAGGDDHTGHAGTDFPLAPNNSTVKYRAGLMAVRAPERTREAVWQAMWERRVFATSGPRVLLDFDLNGAPMGSELSAGADPSLRAKRCIRVVFHGMAPIARVDIIRNNEVIHSAAPDGMDCDLVWEDATPLDDIWLPAAKWCDHPFCFYYVRVVQEDDELAWASPIWIDPE